MYARIISSLKRLRILSVSLSVHMNNTALCFSHAQQSLVNILPVFPLFVTVVPSADECFSC